MFQTKSLVVFTHFIFVRKRRGNPVSNTFFFRKWYMLSAIKIIVSIDTRKIVIQVNCLQILITTILCGVARCIRMIQEWFFCLW